MPEIGYFVPEIRGGPERYLSRMPKLSWINAEYRVGDVLLVVASSFREGEISIVERSYKHFVKRRRIVELIFKPIKIH